MTRRFFVSAAASAAAAPAQSAGRFFRVRQVEGRWWFIDPAGQPFFSIAMNHIDSATLRYADNGQLWRERYGNSEERWLREKVGPDLRRWGFNSVGWAQEVVIRSQTIHRHSRNWTLEHYQWLGLPYCHLLPFAETHQWERETRFPDFFSKDFEDWCDYVARDHCTRMAGDPMLIGYFYVDCPMWVHTRFPELKQPMFDPAKLATREGREKLFAMASRYYKVTHDAIRRYDRNHLILGDRYEARAPLPDEVLLAARPYVDVLSFQYFAGADDIHRDLSRFHELTKMPVLLADSSPQIRPVGRVVPRNEWGTEYSTVMAALRDLKCCVGWHVCGAYLTNRVRRHGFLAEDESPNNTLIDAVTAVNKETREWVAAKARTAHKGP